MHQNASECIRLDSFHHYSITFSFFSTRSMRLLQANSGGGGGALSDRDHGAEAEVLANPMGISIASQWLLDFCHNNNVRYLRYLLRMEVCIPSAYGIRSPGTILLNNLYAISSLTRTKLRYTDYHTDYRIMTIIVIGSHTIKLTC